MKLFFLIVSTLALVTPQAQAAETLTFHFASGPVAFTRRAAERLVVSQSCEKPDGTLACTAAETTTPLSWPRARREAAREGTSPGTHLCEEQRKGTVVMATDERGDETSFCRFTDGSMIDNGSLVARARKNQR